MYSLLSAFSVHTKLDVSPQNVLKYGVEKENRTLLFSDIKMNLKAPCVSVLL